MTIYTQIYVVPLKLTKYSWWQQLGRSWWEGGQVGSGNVNGSGNGNRSESRSQREQLVTLSRAKNTVANIHIYILVFRVSELYKPNVNTGIKCLL